MRLVDATLKILGLSGAIWRWQKLLSALEADHRERVARYAEAIAGSTARAVAAFERLVADPSDAAARRIGVRELARLSGYVEDLVATLEGAIDGRRLAGIKRRLEALSANGAIEATVGSAARDHIERLARAEGYLRALADGLRAGRTVPSRIRKR